MEQLHQQPENEADHRSITVDANTYTLMLEAEVARLYLETLRLQSAVQQLIPAVFPPEGEPESPQEATSSEHPEDA